MDRDQEAGEKCGLMLQVQQNAANGPVHWQQHINNQELYGSLSRVSETIRARRLRLAGHYAPHNEETASKTSTCSPQI